MEMLSVSLIPPFMAAALHPKNMLQNSYVRSFSENFGIRSDRILLEYASLVLAVIYITKNAYLVFQTLLQNRFVRNNLFEVQRKLLHSFLIRPYEFFLGINTGEVVRIISGDTTEAFSLLTSLLTLFSELAVSGMLIVAIFVISPWTTIGIAFILFVILFVIMKLVRPALRRAGVAKREANTQMNMWLMQSIQGIRELKVMNKREFFEEKFASAGVISARSVYRNQTLKTIPRYMIEAVAMGSFFVAMAMLIHSGMGLGGIIPVLSGIAVAALRLLPSINRISQGIAGIAFGEPMLDKLVEHLREASKYEQTVHAEQEKENTIRFHDDIKFLDISYRYPNSDRDVLSSVSLNIKSGMSIGIVGVSGGGKTTAVDLLMGLLHPQKGRILVDGVDISEDMEGWLSNVGYIPQTIFLLNGTIRDNVAFGVHIEDVDDEAVWLALKEAALSDFVLSLPQGIDTQIGERGIRLSGGQRQRIGIARALYTEPAVLIFDEATSSLDNETEAAILDSIDLLRGRKTMIIVAHRLTTIRGCDVVYRVEGGKMTLQL